MTPARLSQLTWGEDDRRAWSEAYAHARAIDRRRKRLAREAQEKRLAGYDDARRLRIGSAREAHSVHVDVMRDYCTGALPEASDV